MNIKTQLLREFQANGSSIKPNTIMPVLSYLKVDKGFITKNNMLAFIQLDIGGADSYLVDEKILMNMVAYTEAESIEIDLKDGKVYITDGTVKTISPTEPVINFPENSEPNSEVILINEKSIQGFSIASNFINDSDVSPYKCHVFGKGAFLGASDSYIMYMESLDQDLPEIILRKDTCKSIARFSQVEYSHNDSYHFFVAGSYKYGFAKSEAQYLDFSKFLTFDRSGLMFKIAKSSFIRFNSLCVSSSHSELVYSTMQMTAEGLFVKMLDSNYEIDMSRTLAAAGPVTEPFKFNPDKMNKMLTGLPDEELEFYQVGNRYFITGASGFTALISGTA